MKKQEPVIKTADLLTQILSGNWKGKEVKSERSPTQDEVVLGAIEDRVGRGLYSARRTHVESIDQMVNQHLRSHASGEIHQTDECNSLLANIARMKSVAELIKQLFWEYVSCRFCQTQGQDASLVNDWRIAVSKAVPKQPFFEDGHISRQLFDRIVDIFTTKQGGLSDCPVNEDPKGGKVIGTVTDPRIKAIISLRDELVTAEKAIVPISDRKALEAWVLDHKVSDLRIISSRIEVIRQQRKMLVTLMWELVRDGLPEDKANEDHIALGKDWSIVSLPAIESEGFKIIMVGAID